MNSRRIAYALLWLAGISLVASAQGYLSGIALNKKIVTDFYRLVFETRNLDLMDQYVAPDFVDHSPLVEGGREGLSRFIKTLPRPATDDIGAEMKNPPAHIVAEGDLVTFVFKQQAPDPKDKTKTYERFVFDMFRIKNGKIVEHWDGVAK
jgi:predicted SnoaL-like aldol condensation-catalyzing enzyme